MQNNQKVVLITGAARRIGAEIARVLHQDGMNVILHYHHSEAEALTLAQTLNALRPDSAVTLKANLSRISEISALAEQAVNVWGRLDGLINNASKFYKTAVGVVTESAWEDLFASNLKAPFFLAQAVTPYLKKYQGAIINIADIHAERPMSQYSVYCMTKAGIVMLTKALAKELSPTVRVNAIAPGEIAWPEGENSLSDELKQKIISRIALNRLGDPNCIAKAVLFFLRDAEYITGQILTVDGGRSLTS